MRPVTRAMRLLEEIRKIHNEMPIQMALAFLHVGDQGPVTRQEVAEFLGISPTSAYRSLDALSTSKKVAGLRRAGFGLMESKPDPDEGRRQIWQLTARGVRVYRQILETMED